MWVNYFYVPSRTYNDPIVLLMAILLFEAFRKTSFPTWISNIGVACAPFTFGVFLIHTQYDLYSLMKNRFSVVSETNLWLHIPLVLACSIIIFVLCTILDFLRAYIFNLLHIKPVVQRLLRES